MIYLWELPKNCLNKFIAVYNNELSSDRFLFLHGTKLKPDQIEKKPIFELEKVTQAEISNKYDCIPNNSASPLINQKVVDLLLRLIPDEVQFFDSEIHCKDGILTNYKLLNVTHSIKGIDHEKSIYTTMSQSDSILGFKRAVYKPACMRSYKLARDEEYLGHILATEELKQVFKEAKITGARFITPEDFYKAIYPRYAQ